MVRKWLRHIYIKYLLFPRMKHPRDLQHAIAFLDVMMTEALREYMMEWSEEKWTASTHHSVGRQLRNQWGLWDDGKLAKWFRRRGIFHADDMSGIVLTSYWRYVHKVPIELDAQIQHYIDYWKNQEVEDGREWKEFPNDK